MMNNSAAMILVLVLAINLFLCGVWGGMTWSDGCSRWFESLPALVGIGLCCCILLALPDPTRPTK